MSDIYNKFPPERKDELLNWVMIVKPKDEWSDVVFDYMNHYQLKNWYGGMEFVIKWSDDPSMVAYYMVEKGLTEDTEWAMKVIENDRTGYPSRAAYYMVRNGFTDDTEWAMKVIQNAKTGTPSWYAYWMVVAQHATREWYDRNFT